MVTNPDGPNTLRLLGWSGADLLMSREIPTKLFLGPILQCIQFDNAPNEAIKLDIAHPPHNPDQDHITKEITRWFKEIPLDPAGSAITDR